MIKIWSCPFFTACVCICLEKFCKMHFSRVSCHIFLEKNLQHKCAKRRTQDACGDGGPRQGHHLNAIPDSKVHGVNMGSIWDRQDPCWPHVGPTNLAIWDGTEQYHTCRSGLRADVFKGCIQLKWPIKCVKQF